MDLFSFISLCLLSAESAEQRNARQWEERGMRDGPLMGISAQLAHSRLSSRPHLSLHQPLTPEAFSVRRRQSTVPTRE